MSRLPFTSANPLDDPLAMAVAGLLLVLLVRLSPVGLALALPLAVLIALGLAMLRARHGRRGERLRDRRVRESIDGAQQRASQLAVQAELVSVEAMARFQDPGQLELLRLLYQRWPFGMDAREARLLALCTRLEQIDGGLRHLQQQVDAHWPSSEATDAAVTEAIEPLDEALDQIDRLLDAGRDSLV